ncbi:MAG: hypothetical protein RIS21_625 [Planctomycetota bacterium]
MECHGPNGNPTTKSPRIPHDSFHVSRPIIDLSDFPSNETAFRRRFPDEAACQDWLRKRRWPEGFKCDRCGGRKTYPIVTRNTLECKSCRHQTSLTANTPFHKTRKPLMDWMRAIYFLMQERRQGRKPSAFALAPVIDAAYGTANKWIKQLRPSMPDKS